MKYLLSLLVCVALLCGGSEEARANPGHHRGEPRTEVDLVNQVVSCLVRKDTASYFNLFPPFDTLWHMVIHNADNTPEANAQLGYLREHPQSLIEFDPMYNRDIIGRFCHILQKGEDSGIQWPNVVIQRYELEKMIVTRNIAGYERVAPERFQGYIFVRDLLSRLTFCITITEMQKVKGYFYGGQVLNILEASTRDEYVSKEAKEREYYAWLAAHPDTATIDSPKTDATLTATDTTKGKNNFLGVKSQDEEVISVRKEVVDRKYYEGKFDEEIPVRLYVRYMREVSKAKRVAFDGLYKFGDQQRYVRLEITRDTLGNWTMEDDLPLGSMDLVLKNKVYTGTWTNNENQTGYDVVLKQAALPQKKLEMLDAILDKGLSGRIDEDSFEPERKDSKKADDADEKDVKKKKDDGDEDEKPKKKKKSDDDDEPVKKKKEKTESPYSKEEQKTLKKMEKQHRKEELRRQRKIERASDND